MLNITDVVEYTDEELELLKINNIEVIEALYDLDVSLGGE